MDYRALGGGAWVGGAGPVSGGTSSGPGGLGTVRVAEIGLASAAGMAATGNTTAASGLQAETSRTSNSIAGWAFGGQGPTLRWLAAPRVRGSRVRGPLAEYRAV
jgi:hypothetical protein